MCSFSPEKRGCMVCVAMCPRSHHHAPRHYTKHSNDIVFRFVANLGRIKTRFFSYQHTHKHTRAQHHCPGNDANRHQRAHRGKRWNEEVNGEEEEKVVAEEWIYLAVRLRSSFCSLFQKIIIFFRYDLVSGSLALSVCPRAVCVLSFSILIP